MTPRSWVAFECRHRGMVYTLPQAKDRTAASDTMSSRRMGTGSRE
jgi:hypothetical protein